VEGETWRKAVLVEKRKAKVRQKKKEAERNMGDGCS
jgi:hypothetical protein